MSMVFKVFFIRHGYPSHYWIFFFLNGLMGLSRSHSVVFLPSLGSSFLRALYAAPLSYPDRWDGIALEDINTTKTVFFFLL